MESTTESLELPGKPDFLAAVRQMERGNSMLPAGPMPRSDEPAKRRNTRPDGSPRTIPEGVLGADWSMVAPTLQKALDTAWRRGGPIYLWGGPGVGKSCAAAAMYMGWEGSAEFWDLSEVLRWIGTCKSSEEQCAKRTDAHGRTKYVYEHRIYEVTKSFQFMVFDDIGKRTPTEPQQEAFTHLINLRGNKPTIYTSNVSDDDLSKMFHPRIVSRLLSGTVIEVNAMTGDRRQENTQYKRV